MMTKGQREALALLFDDFGKSKPERETSLWARPITPGEIKALCDGGDAKAFMRHAPKADFEHQIWEVLTGPGAGGVIILRPRKDGTYLKGKTHGRCYAGPIEFGKRLR